MTLDGLLQRRMSVQQLLALFDAHAAKTLSDYELSLRLHRLDGRGVLAADGAGADGGAAAASHATARRSTRFYSKQGRRTREVVCSCRADSASL